MGGYRRSPGLHIKGEIGRQNVEVPGGDRREGRPGPTASRHHSPDGALPRAHGRAEKPSSRRSPADAPAPARAPQALVYPIAVPAVCFVLSLFLMPETRHNSIWKPVQAAAAA